jgi:hypothetical protein
MKNFWNTGIGRFLYTSETNEYNAHVVRRETEPGHTHSTLTGGLYTEEPEKDAVMVSMNGKTYDFHVPIGDFPQMRSGAEIEVSEKKDVLLGFLPVEIYKIRVDEKEREVFMKPSADF